MALSNLALAFTFTEKQMKTAPDWCYAPVLQHIIILKQSNFAHQAQCAAIYGTLTMQNKHVLVGCNKHAVG